MTKISAAPMEVLLFTLLLIAYVKMEESERKQVSRAIYLFGLTGMFLLGFTLLRVYMPGEGALHMVNSSGHFPNQSIEALNLEYFGTFHITSLINTGYSYIFGEDAIRFSFLTYQYGTMLFGEFDYMYFLQKSPSLHLVMQAVLLFALLFPLGLLSFIVQLYRLPLLHKLLFATLLFNLLLILKFIFDYPSLCHTDFRFFVPSFLLLAYMFSKGLEPMFNVKFLAYILKVWIGILVTTEMVFFILLLLS